MSFSITKHLSPHGSDAHEVPKHPMHDTMANIHGNTDRWQYDLWQVNAAAVAVVAS